MWPAALWLALAQGLLLGAECLWPSRGCPQSMPIPYEVTGTKNIDFLHRSSPSTHRRFF